MVIHFLEEAGLIIARRWWMMMVRRRLMMMLKRLLVLVLRSMEREWSMVAVIEAPCRERHASSLDAT
jgi:hypothetical protein